MKKAFFIIGLYVCLVLNIQTTYSQGKYLTKIGELDSIYSNTLNEQRKFWVQLPQNFNSKRKYPVVYILDGEIHLQTVSVFQNYYSGGFTPEMILIGISNQTNRTRDLTISKITNRQGGAFNQETGGAEKFTQFLKNELIPHIEKKYSTTKYRTLIGHSFGGLFTINILLYHSELFNNYLAIDPSLDWDNQKLVKAASSIFQNKRFENKSLFISLNGQLHMQRNDITLQNIMEDNSDYTLFGRSNIEFNEVINTTKKNGLKTTWKYYKQDFHGTIAFPSIRDGLISFFRWYQIKDTYKFNTPETPTKELVTIIKDQEKRYFKNFGYKIAPMDEQLLIMSGYLFMDMKQAEKALTFFKFALKYYPTSANVFNAVTDYYLSQKNYPKAMENIMKAYEISKSAYHLKRLQEIKIKTE